VLTVGELDRSVEFYTRVLGLVVTERTADTAYLRGLEEACHHSLVLRRTASDPSCVRIGLRVLLDEDLGPLREHFGARGCATAWAETAQQSRTLHVDDPLGVPLEFCASMPVVPRMLTRFDTYEGGCAQRLDHFQLYVADPMVAVELYASAGFRLSEYIADDVDGLIGAFLQRKGNPHDLVFFRHGDRPELHHVAYTTTTPQALLDACDVASALGLGDSVEYGPGRHGPGHAQYVYLRDPDGHRTELFTTHYQVIDVEHEPMRWTPAPGRSVPPPPYGPAPPRSWMDEAMAFAQV
jgi:catechol 2,3-dioxygenase